MNTLKESLLAIMFGAGLGVSLSAWALPDCETCNDFYLACQAGNTAQCTQFNRLRCSD